MKLWLALRSLFSVVLLPGTVAGYIPWRILSGTGGRRSAGSLPETISSAMAVGLALLGLFVLLWCVWDFFAAGKGTLAPFDAPKLLVVRGLYRFTRNPMYNGVITVLLGEAWLFRSVALLQYTVVMLVIFHLVVVIYEEPALAARFGESYRTYRSKVPRWGFTVARTSEM